MRPKVETAFSTAAATSLSDDTSAWTKIALLSPWPISAIVSRPGLVVHVDGHHVRPNPGEPDRRRASNAHPRARDERNLPCPRSHSSRLRHPILGLRRMVAAPPPHRQPHLKPPSPWEGLRAGPAGALFASSPPGED